MKAGFSKIDITPDEPVPLAGYFHLKDRISRRIRDRLYCRTIAFDDGKTRVALVSLDLLLVTPDLFSALNAFFRERNVFLVIHATHTHSSFGGIWNTLPARMSLGSFRKSLSDRLKERVKRGVLEALDDLREAEIGVAACAAPGLNGNRRTPEGPVDDELIVVRIQREKDQGVLVNYPAHPVIVAERDHHAISADFPGVATAMLENSGFSFAAYLNGALGGVDVLFPAGNIGLEENLQIMAGPLAVKSLDLARKSVVRNSSIRYASETIKTPSVDSNPFFDDRKFLAALSYPLRLALNAVFSSAGITETVMNAFSVGEVLFIGTPADLGVGIAKVLKKFAAQNGFAAAIVMSQCDGYAGYYHLPDEYAETPPGKYRGMAMYENAMAIFGRDFGGTLYETGAALIERIRKQTPF